jgi:hypothetical protein
LRQSINPAGSTSLDQMELVEAKTPVPGAGEVVIAL